MIAKVFVLITAMALLVGPPARAQTTPLDKPECTKANIDSTGEKIAKMKEGDPKKATASSEIESAKEMMSKGNTEECQNHLQKAVLQTK